MPDAEADPEDLAVPVAVTMPVPVAEEDRVEVAVELAVAVYSAIEKNVLAKQEQRLVAWFGMWQCFGRSLVRAAFQSQRCACRPRTNNGSGRRASSNECLLSVVLKVTAVAGHVRLDIRGAVTADCTQVAWCVGCIDCMEETGRRYSESEAGKESKEQSQEGSLHCE